MIPSTWDTESSQNTLTRVPWEHSTEPSPCSGHSAIQVFPAANMNLHPPEKSYWNIPSLSLADFQVPASHLEKWIYIQKITYDTIELWILISTFIFSHEVGQACAHECIFPAKARDPSGAEVRGGCELPEVHAVDIHWAISLVLFCEMDGPEDSVLR